MVGAELDLATFLRCSHVTTQLGRPSGPTLADAFFEARNLERHVAISTHDFTSLAAIVVGTNYIATMQTRLALASQACMPLRVLPTPVPAPPLRICMQWHHNQTNDLVHRWLREQLLAVVQEGAAAA